eukprot:2235553-Rhodomonas_salina.3
MMITLSMRISVKHACSRVCWSEVGSGGMALMCPLKGITLAKMNPSVTKVRRSLQKITAGICDSRENLH